MKFKINNDEWTIEEKPSKEIIELYSIQKYPDEDVFFVFGLTNKAEHIIYINKDMCEGQKIKTLKHELTHCYIWNYGLYNVPNFNEEMVCDLVASSNDFINEIVNEYLGIKPLYLCDKEKNIECDKKSCGECMITNNIKYAKRKE